MKTRRIVAGVIVIGFFAGFFALNPGRSVSKTVRRSLEERGVEAMPKNDAVNNPGSGRNLLSREKSPYLLQHADNPVHWYPWGDEAFARAKAENKPVFLSIGYSTCHWCHVMAHESFENPDIAEVMNRYFVSIKVDREERPDLDNIYMKAVMSLTGSGGWPLSAFLTPDRKPFYGGTYFPPDSQWGRPGFKQVLLSISEAWQNNKDNLVRSSESLTQHLQAKTFDEPVGAGPSPDAETCAAAYAQYRRSFDARYGGFGEAPKFPAAHNLSFLLRFWKRTGEPMALQMVETTLTEMAQGGMSDHIGGGFHRYSTDQRWHIPHFEKMLYDQAILTKAYLEAYQAVRNERYARTARDVFEYVLEKMTDDLGGFYSAEDADSVDPEEGVKREGAFYVWGHQEIVDLLGRDAAELFNYVYGVEPHGNALSDPQGEFTRKNILYAARTVEEAAQRFGKTLDEVQRILDNAKEKMFEIRNRRPQPHRDDKVLVDWNGLMISSLALGSRVLEEPRYRDAAEKAAQFILKTLVRNDGRLLHRYRDGEAGIPGSLEDYAFFIHGLIDLYEATFNAEYLKTAVQLTDDMIRLFWDEREGGFFFTATDAEPLIVREKELYDGAIPSGNSMAALDLLRLGRLTLNRDWDSKAQRFFRTFGQELTSAPTAYAQSLSALDFALGPSREIVLAGDPRNAQTQAMIKSLYSRFIPNKVVILRPASLKAAEAIMAVVPFVENQKHLQGQTTAYVCKNHACEFPTQDIQKFEQLLEQ